MKFTIRTDDFKNFENEIVSICKKFKVSSYKIKKSEEYKIKEYKTVGKTYPIMGCDVEVVIPEIEKIQNTGYVYLGCVKNEDNILSVHPTSYATDKEINLSSLKDEIKNFPCEECGKKIFRKIIHVFEKDEKITVYGSGCAMKKFGINLENTLLRFINAMNTILECENDEGSGGFYGDWVIDINTWITLCFCNIYSDGYVSNSSVMYDGGCSTAETTCQDYELLNNYYKIERKILKTKLEEITEKSNFDFNNFISWLPSLKENFNEESDFHFNMRNTIEALINMSMPIKMKGYVAYIVFCYWKEKHTIEEKKDIYKEDYSNFNIGDKVKDFGPLRVKIVGSHSFFTEFGVKYIYTMKDLDNNYKWKWFSTVEIDVDVEHEIYSGTIKSFEDHEKYGKSIVLTRCKTR